eukprot:SAG11_NODE_9783_length_881_cov_0.976982_1_plen_72_part_00
MNTQQWGDMDATESALSERREALATAMNSLDDLCQRSATDSEVSVSVLHMAYLRKLAMGVVTLVGHGSCKS